ncbi:DnaJ 2 [Zea mays]|uniref:DnaJ 2 n=1 Tax=Zea mays TaxID=4577 RepID=A0A3L6EGW1_MAIZE|nr:DnaJ 2 [Zea mays]
MPLLTAAASPRRDAPYGRRIPPPRNLRRETPAAHTHAGRRDACPRQHSPAVLPRRTCTRLDRRNAVKRVDYEAGAGASVSVAASWSFSSSADHQRSPGPGLQPSRSLDLAPGADLRISGSVEGEVDELCRSLGLSGPEDFAIPVAAWEARKSRSNSDLLPRSHPDPSTPADEPSPIARVVSAPDVQPTRFVPAPIPATVAAPEESPKAAPVVAVAAPVGGLPLPSPRRGGGESFAPREQGSEPGERVDTRCNSDTEEESEAEDGVAAVEGELKELRIGETFEGLTGTSSLSTTNDDDVSITTTEAMFIISPNGKFKHKIKSWMRGALLGSGSFGMVYEGISDQPTDKPFRTEHMRRLEFAFWFKVSTPPRRSGGRRSRIGRSETHKRWLRRELGITNDVTSLLQSGASSRCAGCQGSGFKVQIRQLGHGMIQQMQHPCNECKGSGETINDKDRCPQCKGVKVVPEKKVLEVVVQKGMQNVQKITFPGEADEAPDTATGDIIFVLQQKEHPKFKRKGDDLF